MEQKPWHTERGFRNIDNGYREPSFRDFLRWMSEHARTSRDSLVHFPVEIDPEGSKKLIESLGEPFTLTWLGHSSFLARLDGVTVLIDPIWSVRSSPITWLGPRRHTPPPIPFEDIPPVDVVFISHNHYDHLDIPTLRRLGNSPLYLTPLGVGEILSRHGISHWRELDWWDFSEVKGVLFTCTPAQHFSSRSPFDRNRTLWCSWAVTGEGKRFFHGGDSGYFPGFREIGEKLGPFDAAALPIGAYKPEWFMGPMHMGPDDAVRAAGDLGARVMIPIHWGAFNLADDFYDYSPAVLEKIKLSRSGGNPRIEFLRLGETRIITSE